MKQSKKLTRAHYKFLSKRKVPQEVVDTLRFYREDKGTYIFMKNDEALVRVGDKGELIGVCL